MRRRHAVLLAVVLATGANPAVAQDDWAGSSCNLPDGAASLLPDLPVTGTLALHLLTGWFVVANQSGGTVTSATLTCRVQVNNANYGAAGVARTSTGAGGVAVVADTVQFGLMPGDALYVCTRLSWTGSKGGGGWTDDTDGNPANGFQCPQVL